MVSFIESFNKCLWGALLVLIIALGIYLTVKCKGIQLRLLPKSFLELFSGFKKKKNGAGISPYRALSTALAATVGTGNLAGVAGAIAIGGPGAIFWMWISGLLGMIIKFAEVVTAIVYRKKNKAGEWVGGPMKNIQEGMPQRYGFLAYLYSFFGIIAAFGIGNATQVNTIVGGLNSMIHRAGYQFTFTNKLIIGMLLAAFVVYVFCNGIERISACTQLLVPFAAGIYILLAVAALAINISAVPKVFVNIFRGAFQPRAVTGGVVGSAFQAMRVGVSRGVYTNEAGMGTASIAHATADVENPVSQGLLGIAEVFIDTILICTLTALVILCSGIPIVFGNDVGIQLTMDAFASIYDAWVLVPLTVITCLLALATILGWSFYGVRCAQFIFGDSAWKHFILLQGFAVILGVLADTSVVWVLSEITNALMALPNLLALFYLAPHFFETVKGYRSS